MHKDQLRLEFQCQQDWQQMKQTPQGRHCQHCQHTITDVSSMSFQQFQRFTAQHAGETICIRYLYDSNNKVVFQHHTPPWQDGTIVSWLRQQQQYLKTASLAGVTALALAACDQPPQDTLRQDTTTRPVHFDQLNAPRTQQRSQTQPDFIHVTFKVTSEPQKQIPGPIDNFELVLGKIHIPDSPMIPPEPEL